MVHFKIDIISDVVCPWCYVGQRRLQRAIALFTTTHPLGRTATFTIAWHPFYLDPAAPTTSIPLRERMLARFGGAARVDAMNARLAAIGAHEGIAFSFDARTGSTRDAHRLLQLAASAPAAAADTASDSTGPQSDDAAAGAPNSAQNALVTALFRGYFEHGADITDTTWLAQQARDADGVRLLSDETLRQWRDEDGGGALVDREAARNRALTGGVPHFTVNDGEAVLQGAQEPEAFLRVFADIADKEGGAAASVTTKPQGAELIPVDGC